MSDWIEHNGGPQPVGDDVWVDLRGTTYDRAGFLHWDRKCHYRILNQHLIDAKQAEIDQLRDDLETWQSVFPHVMPDRLKSDQQLAEEDVAAKIDAARLEGIRLGLEAAATTVCRREIEAARELEQSGDCHSPAEGRFAALAEATDLIRALNPDTIARDRLTKPAPSDLPPSSSDCDKEADQ